MPSRPRRAASISASVGPVVSVAIRDVKDLLHDLANRGERVELTILNLVEQPPQLVVARDRLLEMHLRPRRRDGEDLTSEVLAAALLEQPLAHQELAVSLDLLPQLGHVLASRGFRHHDWRPPGPVLVERQDRANLAQHRL